MDVTNSNFSALLPKIKEAISSSDLIAVDCELTGLNTGFDVNAYDTQRRYYEKVRRGSKDFLVIQYGLCIFRYDKESKVFKQQGYNFYVFPRHINRLAPDHRFLCQASSIDFLASKGFDFNKLFNEGISYLNLKEEEKYRKSLQEKQKQRADQLQNSFSPQNNRCNNSPMTQEEKTFVDNVFKQIEKFKAGADKEMILPRCNAYMRRLVYQEADKRLDNTVSLETRQPDNRDRVLVVMRAKSKEEREEEEAKKVEEEEQQFNDCIGFSEVIKWIVASSKLLIGHNMCLDLLHTIDKFLTPLPEDYQEFKELANCSFSNLVDTKYMSSMEPFKELISSSVLPHLLETVGKEPFSIPPMEVEEHCQGYGIDDLKEHEAGYDAFITGVSFLAMWDYLGKLSKVDDPFCDTSLLSPYKNRLYLMKLQDVPCMYLGGSDFEPCRDHVLYITFPKEWKLSDIVQLFSPFGNVHVSWIDDHSAYVGLQKRDQTAVALSTLSQSDTYNVTTYAKRQAQLYGHDATFSTPYPLSKNKRSWENVNAVFKKKRAAAFGEYAWIVCIVVAVAFIVFKNWV